MREPFVSGSVDTGRLLFREVVYADGCDMPPHEHDIDCLVFMLEGTMTGALGNAEYEAGNAHLMFMPAWLPHSTRTHGTVRTFDVVFSSDFSDEHREFLPRGRDAVLRDATSASWIVTRMHRELQQSDRATPLVLAGLTLELLGSLSRSHAESARRPRWLNTVVDYIHAHLGEPVSLDDVARTASVHPAHLTRVFRAHFGCTVGDYSRTLRLHRACAAIAAGDAPLAEIALEAGFADQSHFSRAFKACIGLTPGRYREMSRMQVPSKPMQLPR